MSQIITFSKIKFINLDFDNEKLYSLSQSIPNNWTIKKVLDFLISRSFISPDNSTSRNLLIHYGNGEVLNNYEDYDIEFGICSSDCYSVLGKTIEEYEWKDNDVIMCSRESYCDLSLPEISITIINGIGGAECEIDVPTDTTVRDIIVGLMNDGFLDADIEWCLIRCDGYTKDKYRKTQILDPNDCRMLKGYKDEGISYLYIAIENHSI